MLYVKINELNNLMSKCDLFDESNVYIRLIYDNQINQTTIKYVDDILVWNEQFLFDYTDADTLTIEIYNYDNFNDDPLLATSVIVVGRSEIIEINTQYLRLSIGNIFHKYQNEVLIFKDIIQNKIDENNKLRYKLKQINDISII